MKRRISLLILAASIFVGMPATVSAQPAPAPDATFLISADGLLQGQSANLGPSLNQLLDEYWRVGSCPLLGSYAYCDALRFGMSVFPPASCDEGISPLIAPGEDGGGLVEDRIKSIHREDGLTFCDDAQYRPFDTALDEHHEFTFPNRSSPSETELDAYWERPRLSLMVIGDLPQKDDADTDDRVLESLRQACTNLEGGESGELPSMPTWVMALRRGDDGMTPYGELLAAAGGTGVCCYGFGCDPVRDRLDVCDHVNDGRNENRVRNDLRNGRYTCGSSGSLASTGIMAFNEGQPRFGTLPEINCLFAGEGRGRNCSTKGRRDLDLLGIFACVRQLPRGVTSADAVIEYCPPSGEACETLSLDDGDFDFIDERETLFVVNDRNKCDGIEISECKLEGQYCTVEGQVGRCAIGQYECIDGKDVCVQLFDPMPEICNGLDDDCDGTVDNFRESWEGPFSGESLPSRYEGLDCNLNDVCVCPDGATGAHTGQTRLEHYAGWSGACNCGSGLEAPAQSTPAEPAAPSPELGDSGCSSTDMGAPAIGALLALLGFMMVRRRR